MCPDLPPHPGHRDPHAAGNHRAQTSRVVGRDRRFASILGTRALKVFDLVIARTGLRENEAIARGFTPVTTATCTPAWDQAAYYPGARKIHLRITADVGTRRLLGAQMIGDRDSSVHKRIDLYAAAIFRAMTVDQVEDLDLSYTPPLAIPLRRRATGRPGVGPPVSPGPPGRAGL